MKRSEALKGIYHYLRINNVHSQADCDKYAEDILTGLENQGMLPPDIAKCSCCQDYEWEPEDG